MKPSIGRDNNYCHYVILRSAGFAITLNYHLAGDEEFRDIVILWLNTIVSSMHLSNYIYYY
jgi:hypothetical protein